MHGHLGVVSDVPVGASLGNGLVKVSRPAMEPDPFATGSLDLSAEFST